MSLCHATLLWSLLHELKPQQTELSKIFLLYFGVLGILSQQREVTKIWYQRSGVVAVIVHEHVVQEPLELAYGKCLERFGDASSNSSPGTP